MKRKTLIKRLSAAALAIGLFAGAILLDPFAAGDSRVFADEQVHSVYTNELIPSAQASVPLRS